METNKENKFEYTIPEGYEARIEDGKVIVTKKESEDERIRKALIGHLKAGVDFVSNGVTKAECIAWREKQKEQKPAEWSEEDERKFLEIRCLIGNYRTGNDEYELYSWIDKIKDRVQPQPKQEWSEEDNNALVLFHELISFGYTERFCDAQTAEDMRRWLNERLKSLRPQPKQEWSEEDERKRQACISTINEVIDYERERWEDYNPGKPYRPIMKYDEQIDWLKSLRPQPHWKPSDEQMIALRSTMYDYEDVSWYNTLASLYEDLEKLL